MVSAAGCAEWEFFFEFDDFRGRAAVARFNHQRASCNGVTPLGSSQARIWKFEEDRCSLSPLRSRAVKRGLKGGDAIFFICSIASMARPAIENHHRRTSERDL